MSQKKLQVLLIEDNPGDVRLIKEMLADAGTRNIGIESAERASQRASTSWPGVVSTWFSWISDSLIAKVLSRWAGSTPEPRTSLLWSSQVTEMKP